MSSNPLRSCASKPSTNLLIASSMLAASCASKHSSSSGGQGSASLSSCCSSELTGGCTTSLRAASRCAPRNPEVKYADHNDVYWDILTCHQYISVYPLIYLRILGIYWNIPGICIYSYILSISRSILGIYALIPSILLVFFHALSYGGAFSHALSYGIFQAGQVICKFLYPRHRHLHINPLPLHSLLQSVQLSMRTDRSCNSGRQDSRGICQIPR